AIPGMGKVVTGDSQPYSYLVESIRKFPDQRNFAMMVERAGFDRVTFRNYTGGIAALHSGWKLRRNPLHERCRRSAPACQGWLGHGSRRRRRRAARRPAFRPAAAGLADRQILHAASRVAQ